MFLYIAKSLLKGGRVALMLYEGVAGSSMAVGPGKVTVLSNLQEGCVARNPSVRLYERLKVALTSEAALVVQTWCMFRVASALLHAPLG